MKKTVNLKRLLKLIICNLSYSSGLLHFYLKYCLSRQTHHPCVIINYHGFYHNLDHVLETEGTISHRIEDFKEEMKFLKRYFQIISLDEVVDHLKRGEKFNKPTVAITIDDGFKNNFDLLFPVLKNENIPATIFLTTGLIGTQKKIWVNHLADLILKTNRKEIYVNGSLQEERFPLDSLRNKRRTYLSILGQIKDMPIHDRDLCLKQIERQLGVKESEQRQMLNWEEVRLMQKYRISFGAHTCTHPILTNMPLKEAQREITESKQIIEYQLGEKVKHFAYPNGRPQDFNEELRQFCKDIGFESISTCDFGHNAESKDVYTLKRIGPPLPLSVFAFNLIRAFYK